MPKLYLRIYLAVLASLAAFALASGFLWRQLGDAGPAGHAFEVAGTLAQNVLPPAGAPTSEQQAALDRLAANLRADVALFAADRTRLAAVGDRCHPAQQPNSHPGTFHNRLSQALTPRLNSLSTVPHPRPDRYRARSTHDHCPA